MFWLLSPSFPCLHPIPWIYQVCSHLRALAQAEFLPLSFSGTRTTCILTSFRSLLQRPFSLWTFSWFSHLELYPLPHFIPYSYLILPLYLSLFGSQHMQVEPVVKNTPANAGDIRDVDLIPQSGRSRGGGHGNPLQYFCLENPMVRGVWWATIHQIAKCWTQMKQFSMHPHIHLLTLLYANDHSRHLECSIKWNSWKCLSSWSFHIFY